MDKNANKLERASEYDKTGGIWEIDAETKSLRKKITNALDGKAPVDLSVGEEVVFSTMTSFEDGKITKLDAETCDIASDKNVTHKIAYARVFRKSDYLFS